MKATVNSGPITADLYLAEVPRDKWHGLMLTRRTFLHIRLPHDCRELLRFVAEAERMYEPLGFASVEDFIRRGLELDLEQVGWAVEGYQRLKPNEPTPYKKAVDCGGRRSGQAMDELLREIAEELARARAKFPTQDRLTTLVALGEEFGEVCAAVLQSAPASHTRCEAVQVCTMAIRLILDCGLSDGKAQ